MKPSVWTLHRILGAVLGLLGFIALVIGTPSRGSIVTLDTTELGRIVEREVDHVNVDDLAAWIIAGREDFRLLDLRSPQEFADYHIPRAENVPVASLSDYPLLRNETIVLYSEGGIHSAQAWFLLKAKEYKGVYMLRGGLDEWKEKILFPRPAVNPTPEEAAAFARAREVSRFFGGSPQETGTEQRGAAMTAPLPKLPTPAAPPAGTPVAGKKKKEGC
jgi:rhodanese-related sulfurtransferase